MSYRYPDKSHPFLPSSKLLMNPHKGFSSFQRFRGDRLNENWTKETGWMMEQIPDGNLFCGKYSEGHPGDTLRIDAYFQNLGVAPIYHRYPLVFRLTHENGMYCTLPTDTDITAWLPGTHQCKCELTLPQDLPAGTYSLEIGITDGDTVVHPANDLQESDGFRTVFEGFVIRAEENS